MQPKSLLKHPPYFNLLIINHTMEKKKIIKRDSFLALPSSINRVGKKTLDVLKGFGLKGGAFSGSRMEFEGCRFAMTYPKVITK